MVRIRKYTKKTYKNKNKNKNKNKTRKNNTHKNKNKRKTRRTVRKNKRTIGSGKWPKCRYGAKCTNPDPEHKRNFEHPECPYGANCTRLNWAHIEIFHNQTPLLNGDRIRLFRNNDEIIKELQESYKLFTANEVEWANNTQFSFKDATGRDINGQTIAKFNMLSTFPYNKFIPSELAKIKTLFYYHLLEYIACNVCDLINREHYNPEFFIKLFHLLENANDITGIFPVFKETEPDLWLCLDNLYGVIDKDIDELNSPYMPDEIKQKHYTVKTMYADKDILPRFISNTHIQSAIINGLCARS